MTASSELTPLPEGAASITIVMPRPKPVPSRSAAKRQAQKAKGEGNVLIHDDRSGPKWAIYIIAGGTVAAAPPLALLFLAMGWISVWDLVVQFIFGSISILGVTAGLHRYFTHRGYVAAPWFECVLAVMASFAIQGGVLQWVADHVWHHVYSDTDKDLHSPWNGVDRVALDYNQQFDLIITDELQKELAEALLANPDGLSDEVKAIEDRIALDMLKPTDHGKPASLKDVIHLDRDNPYSRLDLESPFGQWGALKALAAGFWHAHVGWLFTHLHADPKKMASWIAGKRHLQIIDNLFIVFAVLSFGLPVLLKGFHTDFNTLEMLKTLGWSFLRVAFVLMVTWTTNSVCHIAGKRSGSSKGSDRSTNVWWLWFFSFGENFHHRHHSDPRSARHGVMWYEPDITWYFIWSLEKAHIATEVRRPRQEARSVLVGGRRIPVEAALGHLPIPGNAPSVETIDEASEAESLSVPAG